MVLHLHFVQDLLGNLAVTSDYSLRFLLPELVVICKQAPINFILHVLHQSFQHLLRISVDRVVRTSFLNEPCNGIKENKNCEVALEV